MIGYFRILGTAENRRLSECYMENSDITSPFPPPGTENTGNLAYTPRQKIVRFFSEETERTVGNLSIKQIVSVGSPDKS